MNKAAEWIPGKLWSLADMARIFDAARFADEYALLVTGAQHIEDGLAVRGSGSGYTFEPASLAHTKARTQALYDLLFDVGLDVSASAVHDVLKALDGGTIGEDGRTLFIGQSLATLHAPLKEMTSIVGRELKSRMVLVLSQKEAHLLESKTPNFGDQVFAAFGPAAEDIEEAAKCLALGRATAVVFHLMRALETAVQTIADRLGVAIVDHHGKGLGWGVIADNMKPKIDAMQRGGEKQTKWYRVQNDLVVINRAWRVPTSHPKQTYSLEQAQEVFDATRAFMRELAPLV